MPREAQRPRRSGARAIVHTCKFMQRGWGPPAEELLKCFDRSRITRARARREPGLDRDEEDWAKRGAGAFQ